MKKPNVCIVDYGSGNVHSVFNLLKNLTSNVIISREKADIQAATHLVLPGVGAFGSTMEKIRANLPLDVLHDNVFTQRKPFLGICVGMQVLAGNGIEFGQHEGLGWIKGTVQALSVSTEPLPHVGWNDVQATRQDPLLAGLEKHNDFYFVHSYAFVPEDNNHVVATTEYGSSFCSVIRQNNIMGVQFHPEKSQQAGKKLALNFLAMT